MSLRNMFSNSFETLWQATLVKLPRAVPTAVLKYTSPEGPHPYILDLPCRDKKRTIPVYVFLPDLQTLQTSVGILRSSEDAALEATQISLPVLLDFHGGGFFMGSPLEQAPFCALLSRSLPALVLSIDYRMAPLDKFPAAIHDAEDVLQHVLDRASSGGIALAQSVEMRYAETLAKVKPPRKYRAQGQKMHPKAIPAVPKVKLDSSKIAVAGFSSGGNIALNTALSIPAQTPLCPKAWPSPFPSSFPNSIPLLIFYPSLDLRALPSERSRPKNLPLGSSFWSRLSDNLAPSYVSRELSAHPRASPGLASVEQSLHEKAKILLVLPELDALSEQSEIWVKKVRDEGRGADLQVERYEGMKHGWTQFPETWLDDKQKETRKHIFDKSISFVRTAWQT